MRKIIIILILFLPGVLYPQFVQQQRPLDGNNISSYIINSGIFNQDISQNNHPGFEWPKGSGKFAIFSSGLTIAAKVNGQIRMASASYNGEYRPGYIFDGQPYTNQYFKIYKIKRGDNQFNNPDYANWGFMIEYGAPYDDVNNNGLYEPSIDKPGVKDAAQTVFICLTDGFPESHTDLEGFAGGTAPLMTEVHFTAWCYDNQGLEDVQFLKWEVVNKSVNHWNGTILSLFADMDLGYLSDDRMGCDTLLELAYTYNGDSVDGNGSGNSYGSNPPAVGISFLETPNKNNSNQQYGLTSLATYFDPHNTPSCMFVPENEEHAYLYMQGLRRDGSPLLNPQTLTPTKLYYTGDPEAGTGWVDSDGFIWGCGNDTVYTPGMPPGDRKFIISSSDTAYKLSAGESTTIVASQQIARGTSHLNSVTKLKELTVNVRNFWETVGIQQISSGIPQSFKLNQNYPNPFNPSTKIRFEIPKQVRNDNIVKLIIYDIAGREITKLVNQELAPGVYEYEFDGTGLASGMYFYRLEAGDFVETRKMVLLK